MSNINIFKDYLLPKAPYSGGKGIKEVQSLTGNKKIHKLSSNENAFGASPKAIAAIKAHIDQLYEYPERTDIRLRSSLADFYKGKLSQEQFVTENSGVALLEIICRAFLKEGNESIVCNPCFKPYMMFTKSNGAKIIDVPLSGPNFDLDVSGILSKITEQTRLIFITNPNNPTGTSLRKKDIDALINATPEHVVIVIDEVYYQFARASDYVRAYEYLEKGAQVIGVNSFSKAYGLAGLRMGYAYSTPKIAAYLRQLNRPFNLNTLALEASIAALSDHEFIDKIVTHVNNQKPSLYEAFERLNITYWKSEANFIMFKSPIPCDVLEAKMLKAGVMIRPVAKFGAAGCIRVTIGTEEANHTFINALENILNEQ